MAARPQMTVYKSATCGCCSKWVEHMQANGFDVKAIDVDDIDKVKRDAAFPRSAASCHTAIVNGYVVEGHVPADAVLKVLKEKPGDSGIAVPGMPMGSPGMEVPAARRKPSTSSRSTRRERPPSTRSGRESAARPATLGMRERTDETRNAAYVRRPSAAGLHGPRLLPTAAAS